MSIAQPACPICGGRESIRLYPDYKGRVITTQMLYCDGLELDNRCCERCGFIWNAMGLREGQDIMFDTSQQKPKPQIVSFGKDVKPLQQRTLETFLSLYPMPEGGSMLDFGAGNGSFLRYFHQAFPGWDISGMEPKDDFLELTADLPLLQASNKPYADSSISGPFDMVIVMSVLEHVPDPLHALRWIYERLKPGGSMLMRHPNFANLPGDLFCADHISKLTVVHTRQLLEHCGFEIVNQDDSSMLFYFILRKHEKPLRPLPDCFEETLAIARRCEQIAEQTVLAVGRCVESARQHKGAAAVFGTTTVGAMAHLLLDCREDIRCIVDENRNNWGWKIDGIPVVGPGRMAEYGITDLALAISPLYWKQVAEKMAGHGVRLHIPDVPDIPDARS